MIQRVEGHIVELHDRDIFEGSVVIDNGVIVAIERHPTTTKRFIMPGFVDAHVHIESSMLTPQHFGQLVVEQGCVAVVTDPHEIANVMGVKGIEFMVENAKRSPIKSFFTIPSCVPATPFDRSGGVISSDDTERLAASGQFVALSEMMNVVGVVNRDPEVMAKIDSAKRHNLPIDGHAPLVAGDDLANYIATGITTDHECTTLEEAREKIAQGMKIIIREGSAARNYDTLHPLLASHPDDVMFGSDDLHPDEIIIGGHLRKQILNSLAHGYDLYDVLRVTSINPIRHYNLAVGELRVGDPADFVVVENLTSFDVEAVYVDGVEQIALRNSDIATEEEKKKEEKTPLINQFNHEPISEESLRRGAESPIRIMSLIEGEILTAAAEYAPLCATENLESDIEADVLKIVYINRYTNGVPQVAYCRGFGLRRGAFGSSVSHDSHNIVAVGCSDRDIVAVVNDIIAQGGALSVCDGESTTSLPLPIAGIMTPLRGEAVADRYRDLTERIKSMGCDLPSPFMTLSFMSLVVIPSLKIGERGLFDYSTFDWIE